MPDVVIYIHGLGDFFAFFRRFVLTTWRWRYGVTTHFIDMDWSNEAEDLDTKLARIHNYITQIPVNKKIRLVGESAGGAVAINMLFTYTDRSMSIATVAGKNIGAESMHQFFIDNYPALYEAVRRADKLLSIADEIPRKRITNLYSRFDRLVPPEASTIDGARNISFSIPIHQVAVVALTLFQSDLVVGKK